MEDREEFDTLDLLRMLPAIHEILEWERIKRSGRISPRWVLRKAIQTVLQKERSGIREGIIRRAPTRDEIELRIQEELQSILRPSLKKVINATGIILHTSLGRAPLAEEAIQAVGCVSAGYSNLEFDLEEGKRGSRYQHVDELLCELSGSAASLVVNNNAAAVFLAVRSLAKGKEIVISRGELVEIGGSFRIPDILRETGAAVVEVGTTNRTYIEDYEKAITSQTGLVLKVHPSNYRVTGFSCEAELPELVRLASRFSLPFMYDLGSGCLFDLHEFGLSGEPAVRDVIRSGVDLVTFSGDKVLGGPQAGILLGKKAVLDPIRRHPLHRAVRIDKMTLAALEATLRLYKDEYTFHRTIPVIRMVSTPLSTLKRRAQRFRQKLSKIPQGPYEVELCPVVSRLGGGSMPLEDIKGIAVRVHHGDHSPEKILAFLRSWIPPIIARIEDDGVLFDMRTLLVGEEKVICKALEHLAKGKEVCGTL